MDSIMEVLSSIGLYNTVPCSQNALNNSTRPGESAFKNEQRANMTQRRLNL